MEHIVVAEEGRKGRNHSGNQRALSHSVRAQEHEEESRRLVPAFDHPPAVAEETPNSLKRSSQKMPPNERRLQLFGDSCEALVKASLDHRSTLLLAKEPPSNRFGAGSPELLQEIPEASLTARIRHAIRKHFEKNVGEFRRRIGDPEIHYPLPGGHHCTPAVPNESAFAVLESKINSNCLEGEVLEPGENQCIGLDAVNQMLHELIPAFAQAANGGQQFAGVVRVNSED